MRNWSHTTGIQQAPTNTYSTRALSSQWDLSEKPAVLANANPVSGCTIAAGVVNNQSASATLRVTTQITAGSALAFARHIENAVPRPVPNRTVADSMCTS